MIRSREPAHLSADYPGATMGQERATTAHPHKNGSGIRPDRLELDAMASTISCDLAILGGGLAGGLAALAIKARHPDMDVKLVEAGERIGGNHIWSFFGSDVGAANRPLVADLVAHAWPDYDVAFPAHRRTITQSYYSIESERLDRAVRRVLPPGALLTGRRVAAASPTAAVLADGDRIEGAVIDARGAVPPDHRLFAARRDPDRRLAGRPARLFGGGAARGHPPARPAHLARTRLLSDARHHVVQGGRARRTLSGVGAFLPT